MYHFDFSLNVIDQIVEELDQANKYIRIAIFQLHNQKIFDMLNNKLEDGVSVEVFTLPYDSINANVRERVVKHFNTLINNGAKIYFCAWNVGDPGRTSTAVGRWYSFHGKFIVTDNSAISLSANFTDQAELDAILIYRDEPEIIRNFNNKFDELIELFISPISGYDGKIRSLILNSGYSESMSLFETPEVIESNTHNDHWIRDYPSELCPEQTEISSKLYICPFDIRGRSIITEIINCAEKYLYISTESFTDDDITDELIKTSLRNVEIKILSGDKSMDFADRMGSNFRYLIATGIDMNTTCEDLHAKLIISDKIMAVSSINLNKMNLGYKKSSRLWRENTETITLSDDKTIISDAKNKFLSIFNRSRNIELSLASKIESDITTLFIKHFGLRSKQEVKTLFSRFLLNEEINVKRKMLQIGKICKSVMELYDRKTISKKEFLMALILYFLSDNKLIYEKIEDRLSVLDEYIDLKNILNRMILYNLIEKDYDYYKLKVLSLF